MAQGLLGNDEVQEDVIALATADHANAQHVLLLALCHACSQTQERGALFCFSYQRSKWFLSL